MSAFWSAIAIVLITACGDDPQQQNVFSPVAGAISNVDRIQGEIDMVDPKGMTLNTRILPPGGYERLGATDGFATYLRELPLKPHGSDVKFYDGSGKPNNGIYDAVIDLPIGNKDLHQCADAIMRLRAEYLWQKKEYDKIHFNFTNGFRVDYNEWMKGKRVIVMGNSVHWSHAVEPSNTYDDLWKYLETVFTYAGTLSLSKELKPVHIDDMNIGDVFIQGGSPGHAIIVVDMATDHTGKRLVLLAQSYMPAQEIQILKNPNDPTISPWYAIEMGSELRTPEWTFSVDDLKRFEDL